MAVFSIKSFGGISPKIPARYLKDSQAQIALNCPVFSGPLVPIQDVGQAVHTITKPNAPKTIYRFGQDIDSDTQHWFNWPKDVDVCRSQIAGDISEWTFFTGDGIPRATYSSIATSSATLPSAVRPLGLPTPTEALSLGKVDFQPDQYSATLTMSATVIDALAEDYLAEALLYGVQISLTDQEVASYTQATLTAPVTAASVAAAINLVSGVSAEVESGGVVITTDAKGEDVKLFVRASSDSQYDYTGTFAFAPGGYDKTAYGSTDSLPSLTIADDDVSTLLEVRLYSDGAQRYYQVFAGGATAATIAADINSNVAGAVVAAEANGNLLIIGGNTANTSSGTLKLTTAGNGTAVYESVGSDLDTGATIIMSQPELNAMRDKVVTVYANGTFFTKAIPPGAVVSDLSEILKDCGVYITVYGTGSQFAYISTVTVGADTSLRIAAGEYPTIGVFSQLSAEGYDETPTALETRVYTWTWVNKESGFEFESGPSSTSVSIDVFPEQGVNISGRPEVPVGYYATDWRIYRSVSGVYLFVAEVPVGQTTYTDNIVAELLSEELPSLTWSAPPAALSGLTNLPNGIIAGFVGRDVYFCDPYHPHAWPQNYVQSLDYPVVGLGRMDTTLAVLTRGTPYFIQGSHPDSMTAVRSDLEQACVAKRSIVSTNGVVIYASPDGLVMLSSSGSKLLTENLFTRAQWQQYFEPESIHAYSHDLKYIGFYDNGTTRGGFIFDPTSGQFILHDIYAVSGYTDLRRDKLFVAFEDRTISEWLAGATKSYVWKSKKFTLPNILSFSCAKLEAEAYPVTAKFYIDGVLTHTQTVAGRGPFRLPGTPGRDMEVQIEGSVDVFSFAVAQSMQELASV